MVFEIKDGDSSLMNYLKMHGKYWILDMFTQPKDKFLCRILTFLKA